MKAIKTTGDARALRIQKTFQRYDKSGDGSLDIEEMKVALKELGSFNISEIRHACTDLDKNKDGEISFKEFESWIRTPSNDKTLIKVKAVLAPSDSDGVEAAFYNFCGAGRAEMDNSSFVKMCKDCKLIDKKMTEQAADAIFSSPKVKPKGGRAVDFDQFEDALDLVAEKRDVTNESVRAAVLEASSRFPLVPDSSKFRLEPIRRAAPKNSLSPITVNRKKRLPKIDATTSSVFDNSELWKVFGSDTKAGMTLKRLYCTDRSWSPSPAPRTLQSPRRKAGNGRQADDGLTPILPSLPPAFTPRPPPPMIRSARRPSLK